MLDSEDIWQRYRAALLLIDHSLFSLTVFSFETEKEGLGEKQSLEQLLCMYEIVSAELISTVCFG